MVKCPIRAAQPVGRAAGSARLAADADAASKLDALSDRIKIGSSQKRHPQARAPGPLA